MPEERHQQIAEELLSRIKNCNPDDVKSDAGIQQYINQLACVDPMALRNELNADSKRKAFWINIYNAFFQFLSRGSGAMASTFKAVQFFNKKNIVIAKNNLSLNDVEHGMLRRSRIWWAKGYLRKIRASDFERHNRVDRLDPRIHFALNCGAVSCPPIRFYKAEQIDEQLELATMAYLESTILFDRSEGILQLPGLMQMYWADFGKRKGAISFLDHYQFVGHIDEGSAHKIIFSPFERADKLANYSN